MCQSAEPLPGYAIDDAGEMIEPAENTDMWQFAFRVRDDEHAAQVCELLALHGVKVYRAWPVTPPGA